METPGTGKGVWHSSRAHLLPPASIPLSLSKVLSVHDCETPVTESLTHRPWADTFPRHTGYKCVYLDLIWLISFRVN